MSALRALRVCLLCAPNLAKQTLRPHSFDPFPFPAWDSSVLILSPW
jgi:hypothetical protein